MTREEVFAYYSTFSNAELIGVISDCECMLRKFSLRGLHDEFKMRKEIALNIIETKEM